MPKQRRRTSTQTSPKRSVVGLAVCCNATTNATTRASTPTFPIQGPASRAHRSRVRRPHTTSALTVPTPAEQRPNKRLHKAMPKPRQPIHAIKPQSAGEVVLLRSSVVSCAICGSARARRTKSANSERPSPASHAIRKSLSARLRTRCPPSPRHPPVEPTTPSRKAHPKAARTQSIQYLLI